MGKTVILRADGSFRIGLGHLMRLIAIGQELRIRGVKSIFILRKTEKGVLGVIKKYGFCYKLIPLHASYEEETKIILKNAACLKAKIIIIDLSYYETLKNIKIFFSLVRELKEAGKFIVLIDGGTKEDCLIAHRGISVDVVVIPYFGAKRRQYFRGRNSMFLLGAEYFVFRQEFRSIAAQRRKVAKVGKRILVTMGGSDPYGLTRMVVEALLKLKRNFSAKVIIGSFFDIKEKKKIRSLVQNKKSISFIENCTCLAKMMFESDVAIISNGLTKYEVAVTGTPSLLISPRGVLRTLGKQHGKEMPHVLICQKEGVNVLRLKDQIESLLSDYALRCRLSNNGTKIIDEKGVQRIIEALPKEML